MSRHQRGSQNVVRTYVPERRGRVESRGLRGTKDPKSIGLLPHSVVNPLPHQLAAIFFLTTTVFAIMVDNNEAKSTATSTATNKSAPAPRLFNKRKEDPTTARRSSESMVPVATASASASTAAP